ncbi:carboxypeptidase S [Rhizoclosmatium globosum]|uniref:Carboxypeptidase S n=1 Tax=Rhizoclosmatium globosum TaxID=329046 RepID=A0A1Y2BGE8_9FUNG|nr:carboxypeptidase S [Rhizoclosmatium globosum]|eukprot:ORY33889.1 carboxypeptidase S [Rhizoclosmatium globosum]
MAGEATPLARPWQTSNGLKSSTKGFIVLAVVLVMIVAQTELVATKWEQRQPTSSSRSLFTCPQLGPLNPSKGSKTWLDRFESRDFVNAAVERFSGAIQIPTESFDNVKVVHSTKIQEDNFVRFKDHLLTSFPKIRDTLNLTIINTHSLLFTWQGTSPTTAPLLLMSHMDVVPVLPETLSQWTHPPFSGHIDHPNDWIYGRGSVDTKGTVMASLEAIESLLAVGFTPRATVYVSFGHDEEKGGFAGAKEVSKYMENVLGLGGRVGMVVDEGLDSFTEEEEGGGVSVVTVAVAEKGIATFEVVVETHGGHSSVPPRNTGVGVMAQIVAAVEARPFPVVLSERNPFLRTVVCKDEYAGVVDTIVREGLRGFYEGGREVLAEYLASKSLASRYLNALPEVVTAYIQDRVSVDSSTAEVLDVTWKNILPVAKELGLGFKVINIDEIVYEWVPPAGSNVGNVTITLPLTGLEPSPVSPTDNDAWRVMEGTIHSVYEEAGKKVIVAPGLMNGNTDTKFFWGLSKNIYRFAPVMGGEGYHTVNERASIKGYIKAIKFYHELIRNYDEI